MLAFNKAEEFDVDSHLRKLSVIMVERVFYDLVIVRPVVASWLSSS